MSGPTLAEMFKQLGNDTRNLKLAATIGQVVDNKDPENLNRVKLAFNWDFQGTHTAAWAMPVYPLSGDFGCDPPDEGDFLLCLFLEGEPMEPFYLGRTRGIPKKDEAQGLGQHSGSNLGIAVAESVSDMLGDILQWMKSHTHLVTVTAQGVSTTPGTPFVGTPVQAQTLSSKNPVPKLRKIKAKKVRLTERNDPDAPDEALTLPFSQ